jgi:NAD(P)-dependent dehydrogenase (short-subunit alcohol dehydrogenase family)
LHSRNSVEAGQRLALELRSAIYVQADLANDDDRVRLIREAIASWGRLDVLVNNAGISRVISHQDLAAATPDVWHELYEVNVVAPFRLIAEAESALRDSKRFGRPGCIVNISSCGVRPKGASILFSDQGGLESYDPALAVSLAPDIRVNAVAWIGRYATDRRLDPGAANLEGALADAPICPSEDIARRCDVGCIGLSHR